MRIHGQGGFAGAGPQANWKQGNSQNTSTPSGPVQGSGWENWKDKGQGDQFQSSFDPSQLGGNGNQGPGNWHGGHGGHGFGGWKHAQGDSPFKADNSQSSTPTPTPAPSSSASTPSPEPSPAPSGSTGSTSEDQQLLDLVNQARTSAGLKPLTLDDGLNGEATQYSSQKNAAGNMTHELNGSSPWDRIKSGGGGGSMAENIASGQQSAQDVFNSWMSDEPHKANILNADVTKMGVGHVGSMWTQDFSN